MIYVLEIVIRYKVTTISFKHKREGRNSETNLQTVKISTINYVKDIIKDLNKQKKTSRKTNKTRIKREYNGLRTPLWKL